MLLVTTLCTLIGRRELMRARLRKHAGKTERFQLAKKTHHDCLSIKITPVDERKGRLDILRLPFTISDPGYEFVLSAEPQPGIQQSSLL